MTKELELDEYQILKCMIQEFSNGSLPKVHRVPADRKNYGGAILVQAADIHLYFKNMAKFKGVPGEVTWTDSVVMHKMVAIKALSKKIRLALDGGDRVAYWVWPEDVSVFSNALQRVDQLIEDNKNWGKENNAKRRRTEGARLRARVIELESSVQELSDQLMRVESMVVERLGA